MRRNYVRLMVVVGFLVLLFGYGSRGVENLWATGQTVPMTIFYSPLPSLHHHRWTMTLWNEQFRLG